MDPDKTFFKLIYTHAHPIILCFLYNLGFYIT
jgi:hypothetical protein